MFNIAAEFSIEDLEKDMNDKLQLWFNELAEKMMDTGRSITDQAISKSKTGAWTGGGFGNITYNLRSSIGCGLFMNKTIKEDYFPFGAGNIGQKNGRKLMNKVASELGSNEIGLIFVAGENYGVFVQEKGYDVTSMSWEHFNGEFTKKV